MEPPSLGGVQGKVGRGAQGHGLVGDTGGRGTAGPDDLVFSSLNDSVTLYTSFMMMTEDHIC